jgi:hypothetical protein
MLTFLLYLVDIFIKPRNSANYGQCQACAIILAQQQDYNQQSIHNIHIMYANNIAQNIPELLHSTCHIPHIV